MNKFKIVTDSSADMLEFNNSPFAVAPLKIITSEKEYIDNESLNVKEMVEDLSVYKGKSSTSCPNANDWLSAFEDAENIFCVTITATLSGCYNAAVIAKQIYEEKFPSRRVYVLNSLTTGPEMKLIIEKLSELILQGLCFEDICDKIEGYTKKTGLLFVLQSMRNLANNGRVNPLAAKAAGLLGIRVVGKASDKGDLEQLDKCRGDNKVIETVINRMKQLGFKGGKVRIAHCFNEKIAFNIKQLLTNEFAKLQIEVYNCRGLCSFYAEMGGLLIGFEK